MYSSYLICLVWHRSRRGSAWTRWAAVCVLCWWSRRRRAAASRTSNALAQRFSSTRRVTLTARCSRRCWWEGRRAWSLSAARRPRAPFRDARSRSATWARPLLRESSASSSSSSALPIPTCCPTTLLVSCYTSRIYVRAHGVCDTWYCSL